MIKRKWVIGAGLSVALLIVGCVVFTYCNSEQNFNKGLAAYDEGNYMQAVEWYQKAADQNDAGAQYNLGLMYDQGKGVARDYRQSVKWWTKAGKQDHAGAQLLLGLMYYEGKSVNQNYITAYRWFNKAKANGAASAKQLLDELENLMTVAQIEKAQAE